VLRRNTTSGSVYTPCERFTSILEILFFNAGGERMFGARVVEDGDLGAPANLSGASGCWGSAR